MLPARPCLSAFSRLGQGVAKKCGRAGIYAVQLDSFACGGRSLIEHPHFYIMCGRKLMSEPIIRVEFERFLQEVQSFGRLACMN